MTERLFNFILVTVIGILLGCAVYFYLTEDKTRQVTLHPTTVSETPSPNTKTPPTPPPSEPTDENTPPPTNEGNKDAETGKEEQNKSESKDEQKDEANKNTEAKPSDNLPEIVWGIDSASETTADFYACVKENFGDPVIFGRYLGEREGISVGLTPEQVEAIHGEGDFILPIYNHFNDATGYDNGVAHAKEAIKMASEMGIPHEVAIFADIEPTYPVDSEFIRGWFETIEESQYKSGIYGVFDAEQALFEAYQAAVKSNGAILEGNYIWTAAPNVGITTEAEAPAFEPAAPEGSLAWGWQYGLDAETCNIDTNLFKRELVDVLWRP
ncbi:glycoside hydrolase domain-containing protein [Ferdinandcohnia sp. Marseille-Q9671]